MKFTCHQEKLNKALNNTARLVPSRSELPILSNFLLKTESGIVYLLATNLQLSIVSQVPSEIEQEGKTTIPANPVQAYVSSLPAEKLNVVLENNKLKIKGKDAQASFVTMDASDYPVFPVKEKDPIFTFKSEDLAKLIRKTCFAAAEDEVRPVLTGILVSVLDNKATFTATDGFRLSHAKGQTIKASEKKQQLIIPASAFNEVEKLLNSVLEQEIRMYLSKDKNQVIFDFVSVQLASRLLEAEYPDYQKILPTEFNFKVALDKQEMERAVRIASIFAQRDGQTVHLSFKDNNLKIEAQSSEVGEASQQIPVKMNGKELKIAFNSSFLREGLESVEEEVLFEAKDSLSPVRLSSPSDPDFFHVIMPIRVEDE